jgi:oxaloacetate decarboxylase beta subunit
MAPARSSRHRRAFIIANALGFAPASGLHRIIGARTAPTAIYLTPRACAGSASAIAIAAYSYMALIPIIQPPIMRLLTTKKERENRHGAAAPVSKLEKVASRSSSPSSASCCSRSVAPLIGMLMLGNLFRECGVVERLSDTRQNALINIVTIFLGVHRRRDRGGGYVPPPRDADDHRPRLSRSCSARSAACCSASSCMRSPAAR